MQHHFHVVICRSEGEPARNLSSGSGRDGKRYRNYGREAIKPLQKESSLEWGGYVRLSKIPDMHPQLPGSAWDLRL